MPVAFALWRMVALHLLRSPVVWGLLPLLCLVVPLLAELRPLATSTGTLEIARAWAFPAGLTGLCLTLLHLSEREAFLLRVSPVERVSGEWGGCVLAPLLLQLPILLGALVLHPEALDLAHAATDILSSDLHLAGLALLSLALPTTQGRLVAFLSLAWVLPAIASQSPALAPLGVLLDASRPLAAPGASLPAALAGLGLALLHVLRRLPAPVSR